jgi:hypothetical protein
MHGPVDAPALALGVIGDFLTMTPLRSSSDPSKPGW